MEQSVPAGTINSLCGIVHTVKNILRTFRFLGGCVVVLQALWIGLARSIKPLPSDFFSNLCVRFVGGESSAAYF